MLVQANVDNWPIRAGGEGLAVGGDPSIPPDPSAPQSPQSPPPARCTPPGLCGPTTRGARRTCQGGAAPCSAEQAPQPQHGAPPAHRRRPCRVPLTASEPQRRSRPCLSVPSGARREPHRSGRSSPPARLRRASACRETPPGPRSWHGATAQDFRVGAGFLFPSRSRPCWSGGAPDGLAAQRSRAGYPSRSRLSESEQAFRVAGTPLTVRRSRTGLAGTVLIMIRDWGEEKGPLPSRCWGETGERRRALFPVAAGERL